MDNIELKISKLEEKYENFYNDNKETSEVISSYLNFMKEVNFEGLNGYLGQMQEISIKNSDTFAELKMLSIGIDQQINLIKAEIYELQATEGKSSDVKMLKAKTSSLQAEKNEVKKKEIKFKNRKEIVSEIIKSAITLMSNHKSSIR